MKDLFHDVLVSQHVAPVVATTTKTSTAIDLQGYQSAMISVALGQSGDTLSGTVLWTLRVEHSSDNLSYTSVTASDMIDGKSSVVVDAPSEDETIISFGYIGSKRFVRAVATPTGTHTNGTPLAVIAMRANASLAPVI